MRKNWQMTRIVLLTALAVALCAGASCKKSQTPPVSKQPAPVSKPAERKDILGRGEDWWRGQAREWNGKLLAAQKSFEAALTELKNKEKEVGEAKFKPDSLKRKLKAEQKTLQEKVDASKKQVDDARNMLERSLPKQAEEYRADPNWLK